MTGTAIIAALFVVVAVGWVYVELRAGDPPPDPWALPDGWGLSVHEVWTCAGRGPCRPGAPCDPACRWEAR